MKPPPVNNNILFVSVEFLRNSYFVRSIGHNSIKYL